MLNTYVFKGYSKERKDAWLKSKKAAVVPAGKRPDSEVGKGENCKRVAALQREEKRRMAELDEKYAGLDVCLELAGHVFPQNEEVTVDMDHRSPYETKKLATFVDLKILHLVRSEEERDSPKTAPNPFKGKKGK